MIISYENLSVTKRRCYFYVTRSFEENTFRKMRLEVCSYLENGNKFLVNSYWDSENNFQVISEEMGPTPSVLI